MATSPDWTTLRRADGRVEIVCPCGVGHPSRALTERAGTVWQKWMYIHGCDGCCASDEFRKLEAKELR